MLLLIEARVIVSALACQLQSAFAGEVGESCSAFSASADDEESIRLGTTLVHKRWREQNE